MSVTCISLNEVNNLASDLFIKIFGNVVEHYPAAAIGILKNRPFKDVEDISLAVNGYIDSLNSAGKIFFQTNLNSLGTIHCHILFKKCLFCSI